MRKILIGKYRKTLKGYGFIIDDEDDLFVHERNSNGAMNGDIVKAEIFNKDKNIDKRREGKIVEILQHSVKNLVGIFDKKDNYGFVVALSNEISDDVFVKKEDFNGAEDGDIVKVEIVSYPRKASPIGKIEEVVAKRDDKCIEIKSLAASYGYKLHFPEAVESESKATAERLLNGQTSELRQDFRQLVTVTIDGKDSKDLDDAVSCEKDSNGNYILGVHIADVSHFVQKDSLTDREALHRGNSVYLLSKVIPMLPESLSNEACSLNQGEDRLTLSCIMRIGPSGNLLERNIVEGIINSSARLNYDEVSDFFEKDIRISNIKDENVFIALKNMRELQDILKKKRCDEGSIEFDFDESKIILNEKDEPIDIRVEDRRTANGMIEEFMLMANRAVAEKFYNEGIPFIYRVHEKPEASRIDELKGFLGAFGITLTGDTENIKPNQIANILDSVKDKPYYSAVSHVILRSMQKARYDIECKGHFGLAFRYYTHFTSPIRRYPDLLIHRIIKEFLHGKKKDEIIKEYFDICNKAAEISTNTELKAIEAERDLDKFMKAEYMESHIGEVFEGTISGVAGFGFFVRLRNSVEGLVRVESLKDDYYIYNEDKLNLIGENTKNIFSIGTDVRVRLIYAERYERRVDFEFEEYL